MEPFEYSRLPVAQNEIRLITLLPGRKNDQIECELSTKNLEAIAHNTPYEALLYCWGTMGATMKIHIYDGSLRIGIFLVTPTLHAALLVFRREQAARKLWIDAIGIDQMNDNEKNMQVPLMRQIYGGSSGILIWLGEGTKDSDPATSLIGKLKDAAAIARSAMPDINLRVRIAAVLLDAKWFQRAWVVQEVAVSKKATLFWGTYSTDWNDLISGMDFAIKAHLAFTIHPLANSALPIIAETAAYRSRRCNLLGVLLRHRRARATNPVDKVYAFLGLTENCTEPQAQIQVDYGKDVRSVYIDVGRKIAAYDSSLDILSLPTLPLGSDIEGLPSWVPDWSMPTEENVKQLRYTAGGEKNSLANGEDSECRISKPFCVARTTLYTGALLAAHNKALLTRGHIFDTVAAFGDLFEGLYIAKDLRSVIRTIRSILRMWRTLSTWENIAELHPHDRNDKYASGGSIIDAFWQTVATGNFSEEGQKLELRELYEIYRRGYITKMLGLGVFATFCGISLLPILSQMFRMPHTDILAQLRYLLFRRMIRTEQKRYIGLVSGDFRHGDEVWLLEGSKVPLIIRRKSEGYG